MEYVVTGGAGYIGGHLVDRLIESGQGVTVIDDLSTGSYINKRSRFIKFDLRKDGFDEDLGKNPTFIHLAADPDVQNSMLDINSHYERDVTATLNTLEMARKADAKMFVFASSATVYGNAKKLPTPEDYDDVPISYYGLFKKVGERLVEYYSRNYGIKAVSLRFANITGGRVTHNVVYKFAEMMKKNKPIEVWGDGNQRKSYVYISDLMDAVTILIGRDSIGYDTFNIGNDDWITVNEIIGILRRRIGGEPQRSTIETDFAKIGDQREMFLDASKIKKLGWKPKYTSGEAIDLSFGDVLGNWK